MKANKKHSHKLEMVQERKGELEEHFQNGRDGKNKGNRKRKITEEAGISEGLNMEFSECGYVVPTQLTEDLPGKKPNDEGAQYDLTQKEEG